MIKRNLILLTFVLLTLTLMLSGCGNGGDDLEGMYVATFELNGGMLDLKSSNAGTRIHYAYEPGSYILDPANYANYEISRAGFRFTGWYKTEECLESDKWDFATDTIDQEKITLYAGWEREIVYTYSVCYTDGDSSVTIDKYKVSEGAVFDDYKKLANKRDGYTATGYFADAECTIPWDFSTVHPGGETDTDVQVFVDYIEGEWKLVDSYATLINVIGDGDIYLTNDIDCEGKELFFSGIFTHVFEGNGYKISNFTVNKAGGALMPSSSVFQTLGAGSEIRNVSFENVTFMFSDVDRASKLKVAALARDASDCTVTNVSVTGKLVTNSSLDFPRLNEAFYDEVSTGEVTDFTANITVEYNS